MIENKHNPPITEQSKTVCSRCGNTGAILENGLCVRCDEVVFGRVM